MSVTDFARSISEKQAIFWKPEQFVAKKKMGRPTRAAEGRAEAITVRLRPSLAFALELIARDRRVSLSEAAEFVVATCVRGYEVDGKPLSEFVSLVAALEEFVVGRIESFNAHDGKTYTQEEQAQLVYRFHQITGMGKILAMPEDLRTAREQYLFEVYSAPDSGYWTLPQDFLDASEEGLATGLKPEQAAQLWGDIARTKFAADRAYEKKALARKRRG
jgi:hypothetical protein